MNVVVEKLEGACVDALGERLTIACREAIGQHPTNAADVWIMVGMIFGHEFVRGLMGGPLQPKTLPPTARTVRPAVPYAPRIIEPERLERRQELRRIVRSKYRNSGDVPWSDVGWLELHGLKRDGKEAAALLSAGPDRLTNDDRTVGDVLGISKTDEIIARVRQTQLKAER